ncbi:PDZ domain-containing protein [Bhargavaea ginsengi]|uniref:PDZ domain-containing protein n=1 Tax=Bhargavaea ginsengi TaxID=426757 RepID=UPI00203E5719|nr:PDZ domain-containing protein [Bhargavaea ginsengi]MCM3088133.1 PDZ domain-containing protein [Bhargavaea ginsengi]
MFQEILFELLQAAGRFFMNPLLYMILLFSVLLGYTRVRRERRNFRVRVDEGLTEFRRLLKESWLIALVLSFVIAGAGLAVPKGWLVLFCGFMLAAVLLFRYQAGAPVYAAGLAALAYWLIGRYDISTDWPVIGWTYAGISGEEAVTITAIAGLLTAAEGLLIRKYAARDSSPLLLKTGRGLQGAAYRTKRLWLLPLLFAVPGGPLEEMLPYWPQFTLGGSSYYLILIPAVIGFEHTAKHDLPGQVYGGYGKVVFATGLGVTAAAFLGLWEPLAAWAVLAIGFIVRMVITIMAAVRENKGNFAVAPRSDGVVVAAVLPGSPADKMGILPGETIRKVNGVTVTDERELYEAIQVNAAHCRVEVLNMEGELRLCQHVIFRHDHHRMGLLVVR